MFKASKDQWKLATTVSANLGQGILLALAVKFLGKTDDKICVAEVSPTYVPLDSLVIVLTVLAFMLFGFAFYCARRGDKDIE